MADILGTVRASSWAELFDCPSRWYWKHVFGLQSPPSSFSTIGTAIHAGTAVFDQARLDGYAGDIELATDVAHDHIAEMEDVDWSDVPQADATSISVRLVAEYCASIAPKRTYRAVEVSCGQLDIATPHGLIRVTGTTDRIREDDDGRLGVCDLKSGKTATTEDKATGERVAVTRGHHIQLGIYTLMAEQESGLALDAPAEVIGLQTTKAAHVASGYISDVKTPLVGTDDAPGLIEIAAGMLKSGVFPPNPKSTLCSPKFCPAYVGRCIYHA